MSYPQKVIFRALALLLVIGLLPLNARPVRGQEGIALEDVGAEVTFGQTILFHAKIKSATPIKQASLLFRGVNESVTHVEAMQVSGDGSVSFAYDASLNIIPPFSEVIYWFQATLADNNTYTSESHTFFYNDSRFPWREMTRANVTVHWYAGDEAFGAAALDAAGAGMLVMREVIPLSLTDPIHVYIYSNPTDLQATLMLGGTEWVAGHTSPQVGVVLVAVAPGESQKIVMEARIPHELAHVMLYRALGAHYKSQPTWLIEGIASMMEVYPNPDYEVALSVASRNNSLIPFEQLCDSFPSDSGNAFLAYAQSRSFVIYIRESYGTSGLNRLISSYADGRGWEVGATNALGTPLSQLDTRWREDVLGQNTAGVAMRNLAPFILIMALVLIVPLWGTIDILRQRRKRGNKTKSK
jgi:hypothetical protein